MLTFISWAASSGEFHYDEEALEIRHFRMVEKGILISGYGVSDDGAADVIQWYTQRGWELQSGTHIWSLPPTCVGSFCVVHSVSLGQPLGFTVIQPELFIGIRE